MALINCPACGKSVSENAASCPFCGEPIAQRLQQEVDSGTEHFLVNARNRFELPAKTQYEINSKTAQFAAEGKTIVNVSTTEPRPFTAGFTFWQCDVTIVWQASLASTKYKDYLYNQATANYRSGKYKDAIVIFQRLGNYRDAESLMRDSQNRINAQIRSANAAADAKRELENNVGTDPLEYLRSVIQIVCGICLLGAISVVFAQDDNYGFGWLCFIVSGVVIVVYICYIVLYRCRVKTYYKKKRTRQEKKLTKAKQEVLRKYIKFGTYPQTSSGDDATAIEWLVLTRNGKNALLLSRYGLDTQPYNEGKIEITWAKCTLRTWLNDTFINKAFTDEEQSAILMTKVDNSRRQRFSEWNTDGGNNTQDRVFLLSYAEVNKYLGVTYDDGDNTASRVSPTDYAKNRGAYTSNDKTTANGEKAGWWWLRSPGDSQFLAADVISDGSLSRNRVYGVGGCVRPALWVNLESGIF